MTDKTPTEWLEEGRGMIATLEAMLENASADREMAEDFLTRAEDKARHDAALIANLEAVIEAKDAELAKYQQAERDATMHFALGGR